jgi:hypothetical protein
MLPRVDFSKKRFSPLLVFLEWSGDETAIWRVIPCRALLEVQTCFGAGSSADLFPWLAR